MPQECSFKDYVADRFYNELSDIRVVFVDAYDQQGTGIAFDVAVDGDIETIFVDPDGRCRI